MRTFAILSAATALLVSTLVSTAEAQQACNGYAELCSKPYSEVAYATTHNAYANRPVGALAANQNNEIPTQLKDGIRALMLDAYNPPAGKNTTNPNDIELCHSSCDVLDGGPLSTTLTQIKSFLDSNPNEVVTIFWENAATLPASRFQSVYAAAGLTNYLYTQTAGSTSWPTLAQMISSGKRLVNFIDAGADASVPWLMNEYSFVFETPYSILRGNPYPCTIDRPKDQRQQMYVLNHFVSAAAGSDKSLLIPQSGAAAETNGQQLVDHVNNCQSTFNQRPSFIAVDFYEKGSLLQTVAQANGVQWNGKAATQPTARGGNKSAANTLSVGAKTAGALVAFAGMSLLAL
ncbi:hypothetical protein BGW38_002070 [Lunasporangiospora selenospora]|uniref:PLC-like phosphodiesterase n=1 Tax=Lunasporangiospora selenospora TaxID=979761 RepID=A0A9P6KD49_9FUNG|nr:hypothetical protein BGW38_002070 [Lunasporangiospora selenospora]